MRRNGSRPSAMSIRNLLALAACGGTALAPAVAQDRAGQAPAVEVVAPTPIPGLGIARDKVPANVQTGDAEDLRQPGTPTVPDLMERNFDSVNINQSQGNPYQPDINFRGFTGSPLLGSSPGLSLYQDGVRINEPFGDGINWDLLPNPAIANITVMPGSNPVFGLNTLGGAIAITTKNGFDYPGLVVQGLGGSFGRAAGSVEYGGHGERVGYYVTGNGFYEHGWRDNTRSRIWQGFGKLSFRDPKSAWDLSFTGADNTLNGAQATPVSFLDERREESYTFPDQYKNELAAFTLNGRHSISDLNLLQGTLYYRSLRSKNFSTNVNDDFDPTQPVAPGNTQGENVASDVDSRGWGFGLQYSYLGNLGALPNRLSFGVTLDSGRTDYEQSEQEANFASDRSNIAVGDFSPETQARTENEYWGIYVTDTLSPAPWVDVTLSGRYNWAEVKIRDTSGTNPALDGRHTFSRFNPAVGLTFYPAQALTAYASYNEGMRIPTPVELTCADPSAPCSLPNAFLADPPLDPIIARTWEAGLRGPIVPGVRWHATAYQTTLDDDILFVSASASAPNTGFFQNVGTTRRRGVELGVAGALERWRFGASYSYVDARLRTGFTEFSPNNSSADAIGDIQVQPGDRIPGIPHHIVKLRAAYDFGRGFVLGGTMYAQDSQYVRGNENNQDPRGKVSGYTVFNLDARWAFARGWELLGVINNLFDQDYETAGVLGANFFNGPGKTFDANTVASEVFLSPAAPFGAWIGVRYTLGGRGT